MRTLIYARFSSQLQNPRSIGDQIAACRARADAEGWSVVEAYSDAAISGAAGIESDQRPGLHALLARVEAGGIDQVLTESTDRIARHQGDAFAVRERLEFARCRLFTLMDGEVNELTGTFKGLMDSRFRKDLAARVKRGHHGSLREGRATGGIAYGYRKVLRFDAKGAQINGLREVDPDKAAIVIRIYREYAAGRSSVEIARSLNREGVAPPTPRSRFWSHSTIIGHRAKRQSILNNPVYIGEILYGRTRQVVDPRTRRRSFVAGDGEPAVGAAPHLRIVDDDLWEAVQAQLATRTTKQPWTQRRPKHWLSGLAVCGMCGENAVREKAQLWMCRSNAKGGACENGRMINTVDLEQRVLADLKEQMLAPDVVAAYLREYHREHARRSGELTRDRDRIERRLAEAGRKVDRLVAAIAEGMGVEEVREALTAAKADKDIAGRELASLDALPVLALHPGLAARYREQIAELERDLTDDAAQLEAIPRLRALIARVVLTPKENRRRGGVNVEVIRHIDEVLALAQGFKRLAG